MGLLGVQFNERKSVNAGHILGRIRNRLKRISRRIVELNAEKVAECIRAERMKRDPNLGDILAQLDRLDARQYMLTTSPY